MNDSRWIVRPILAVGSLFALIFFYTLKVLGYEIPVEVNGFWGPVSWWFVERMVSRVRERKTIDVSKLSAYD